MFYLLEFWTPPKYQSVLKILLSPGWATLLSLITPSVAQQSVIVQCSWHQSTKNKTQHTSVVILSISEASARCWGQGKNPGRQGCHGFNALGPSSSKTTTAFPAGIPTGLDRQISKPHLLFSTAQITWWSLPASTILWYSVIRTVTQYALLPIYFHIFSKLLLFQKRKEKKLM